MQGITKISKIFSIYRYILNSIENSSSQHYLSLFLFCLASVKKFYLNIHLNI